MNLEKDIIKILSEEIAREIDKEIISSLNKNIYCPYIPTIPMTITKTKVEAKPRKLKAKWTIENGELWFKPEKIFEEIEFIKEDEFKV